MSPRSGLARYRLVRSPKDDSERFEERQIGEIDALVGDRRGECSRKPNDAPVEGERYESDFISGANCRRVLGRRLRRMQNSPHARGGDERREHRARRRDALEPVSGAHET